MDTGNAIGQTGQQLGRKVAERTDYQRFHDRNLLLEKYTAKLDLRGLGIAVIRRPALQNICDVNILAAESDSRQQLFQQFSSLPDERYSLLVFVVPWRLTNENNTGFGTSATENQIGSRLAKLALSAALNAPAKLDQAFFPFGQTSHSLSRKILCRDRSSCLNRQRQRVRSHPVT